jgi:Lrp/AsnC family transcriptional regulator, regulator for asnA, asnC and gidA
MIKLDQVDRNIVALLKRDGRMSNREIARSLDVSEGTVRNRLRRLLDAKAIQLAAVMGVGVTGLSAIAVVRMNVEPSKARSVAAVAAACEEISFSALTAGRYNVTLLVQVRTRDELVDFIHSRLALLDGVTALDTRELVRTVKHRFDRVLIR